MYKWYSFDLLLSDAGLNGIDNGRIWFDHVRVPRENLLNRFADITPEGDYESALPNADKRFAMMIAELVSGRYTIARNSVNQAKVGFESFLFVSSFSSFTFLCPQLFFLRFSSFSDRCHTLKIIVALLLSIVPSWISLLVLRSVFYDDSGLD